MTRKEAYEIVGADPRLARWPQADRERLVDRLMLLAERVDPHRALSPTGGVEYHCGCGGRTPLPADGVPARVYCMYCGRPEPAGPEGSTPGAPDLATRLATLEAETAQLTDLMNHLVNWVTGRRPQVALRRITAWVDEDRRTKGKVGP